jgi:hypothetical protein
MPITATCGACGRNFTAPSQFQGKKVKCKGCGEVFLVPGPGGANSSTHSPDDLDALAQLAAVAGEDSIYGPAPRAVGSTDAAGTDDDQTSETGQRLAKSKYAPNVLTFDYPGAADVDRWLPISLIVVGFLLLLTNTSSGVPSGNGWIGFTRFATPSLLYWAFVIPITLGMIRKACRELRYSLPPNFMLRCFACYMPAFVLITWFQMDGNWLTVLQLFAGILGLAISSTLVWLLFRLRPEQIGTAVAHGAGGFAMGIAISFSLTIGLNKIGALMVESEHTQASVPVSPFGEGLSWVSAPPEPPVVQKNPVIIAVKPASPVHGDTPFSDAGATGRFDAGSIPGVIDDVINPSGSSPFVGIIRTKTNSVSIECWNTRTWKRSPGTLNLPTLPTGNIILNADGERLAWIAEFPRLSVQIWSFSKGCVINTVDLDRSQAHPQLVDFIDSNQFIIDRMVSQTVPESASASPVEKPKAVTPPPQPADKSGNLFDDMKFNPKSHPGQADVVDPGASADSSAPSLFSSQQKVHQFSIVDSTTAATACTFELPPLAINSSAKSVNPVPDALRFGQNIAISSDGKRLVSAVKIDGTIGLLQTDLTNGSSLGTIKVVEIDPAMSGCPTGLAFSNDGANLAALFENAGSALLLSYEATTGKKIANFVYPAGPLDAASPDQFQGSSICWLDPAPWWLVYGQGVLSTETGAHLKTADLNLPDVNAQRFVEGDRVQLLTNTPAGKHLSMLEIDRAKLQRAQDSSGN